MRKSTLRACVATLAANAGCHTCFSEPAEVLVGTGDEVWEPVEDGDPVVMVHGPQNGWHVLGAARLRHVDITNLVSVHFVVRTRDEVIVADNTYEVALRDVDDTDCSGVFTGMYGFLFVYDLIDGERDTPPELLGGEELVMAMEVWDHEGRYASAERVVVAELDPADAD